MPAPKSPMHEPVRWVKMVAIEAAFNAPWLDIMPEKADAAALQAMKCGEATADQQVRSLEFILGKISDRNSLSFRPGRDGARETDFAEGKRFVGNQIVKILNTPLSKIKDNPK